MLLIPDKRKMASLIIASMKPDYVAGPEDERDLDAPKAKEVAAEAVLKAIESKSSKALAEALYQFVEMCEENEEEESESDSLEG